MELRLTDDEKKKLAERHKAEMNVAITRLTKAGFNKAFGDLGDANNPFGNITIGPNAKGVLTVKETQDLLIDKWIIGNSVVEFRTDGTFDGTLPQLGLTAPIGVYEWYAQTSVTLRQANMPGKTLEVVIQGDDLTLKSANAEVYRGKRWTVEGQRKLDNHDKKKAELDDKARSKEIKP